MIQRHLKPTASSFTIGTHTIYINLTLIITYNSAYTSSYIQTRIFTMEQHSIKMLIAFPPCSVLPIPHRRLVL